VWRSLGRVEAKIFFHLKTVKMAEAVFKSLKPEASATKSFRSKVRVNLEGKNLVMLLDSPDITASRASVNSFCRWVSPIIQILKEVQSGAEE
jgi:tRNA threonylcarbamoyladenosine modification (KEOPS) complex  Pcc1 subunit